MIIERSKEKDEEMLKRCTPILWQHCVQPDIKGDDLYGEDRKKFKKSFMRVLDDFHKSKNRYTYNQMNDYFSTSLKLWEKKRC